MQGVEVLPEILVFLKSRKQYKFSPEPSTPCISKTKRFYIKFNQRTTHIPLVFEHLPEFPRLKPQSLYSVNGKNQNEAKQTSSGSSLESARNSAIKSALYCNRQTVDRRHILLKSRHSELQLFVHSLSVSKGWRNLI